MEKQTLHSKKYKKISYEERTRLIELVCEYGEACAVAGKKLGLSPSTAKMIVKTFRDKGKIFEKKEEKTKRELLLKIKENQTENCSNYQGYYDGSVPLVFFVPSQNMFYNPYQLF